MGGTKKEPMKILIVGLGLIGGSLAKALHGFRNADIYGIDKNAAVLKQAETDGVILCGFPDGDSISQECDLVIVCICPQQAANFINRERFKKNALITDVCGVKQFLYQSVNREDIHYVGGHPMAGKENGGYENSDANLFRGASYIITPNADDATEHVTMLHEMAEYIGCKKVVETTPEKHDEMISYTSQLMHVVAIALCDNHLLDKAEGFSAGSLRDCTRVAKLNSSMWSELFLTNREELIQRINEFEQSMDAVKNALSAEDSEALRSFLETASQRKGRYLSEKTNR